jgi:hypothetical protein
LNLTLLLLLKTQYHPPDRKDSQGNAVVTGDIIVYLS